MAVKRLKGEWRCWDENSPNAPMQAFGSFEEERSLWRLQPQPMDGEEVNYFIWEAELQVPRGPLRGASLVYSIRFPRDYPFKPPNLRPQFAGFPVTFAEIQPGWHIYMVPPKSTTGQRQVGTVTGIADGEISVRWISEWETRDEEGRDEEGQGEVEIIGLGSFESQNPPVLGQSKDGVVYHPLFESSGQVCMCGISQKWAPHFTILTVLSFVRVALENPNPHEPMKAVPHGSSNDMCFCGVNGAASEEFGDSITRWERSARARFFTEKGVAPLCVTTASTEPGMICIQCTSLAGTQLGEIQIDSHKAMEDLEREIQEQIPLKEMGSSWKIVLPDGTCISESLRYQSVGSVLL